MSDEPTPLQIYRPPQKAHNAIIPARKQEEHRRAEIGVWLGHEALPIERFVELWEEWEWTRSVAMAHRAGELSSAKLFAASDSDESADLILTAPADVHPEALLRVLGDFLRVALDGETVEIVHLVSAENLPLILVKS